MHAGHGLDYASAETIAGLPEGVELNIAQEAMKLASHKLGIKTRFISRHAELA